MQQGVVIAAALEQRSRVRLLGDVAQQECCSDAGHDLIQLVFLISFIALLRLTGRIKFDVLQAHWVIPNGPVAALVARLRGLPFVVSLHGSDIFVASQNRLLGWVARACFRAADAITACSEDLRERAMALGAPPRRSILVPYGVDPCALKIGDRYLDEYRMVRFLEPPPGWTVPRPPSVAWR